MLDSYSIVSGDFPNKIYIFFHHLINLKTGGYAFNLSHFDYINFPSCLRDISRSLSKTAARLLMGAQRRQDITHI